MLEIEQLYFLPIGAFHKTDALSGTMPSSLVSPAALMTSKEREYLKRNKVIKGAYGMSLSAVIN